MNGYVSNELVLAIVSAFGSVLSALVVKVLKQLRVLHEDMSAIKTHLGVEVKNGTAIVIRQQEQRQGQEYEEGHA